MANTTSYSDSEMYYIKGSRTIAKTPNAAIYGQGYSRFDRSNKLTGELAPVDNEYDHYEYAVWGDNNNEPTENRIKGQKNDIITAGIDLKARMLGAGGLMYGIEEVDEENETVFTALSIPEIDNWKAENRIDDMYLPKAATQFYWHYIIFPEFVLSADRSRINRVQVLDTEFCRWKKMNKYGFINGVFVSPHWLHDGRNPRTGEVQIKPVASLHSLATVEDVRRGKYHKYIYPSYYPSPGKVYYPKSIWTSVFESGWYDVAKLIPESKIAGLKNHMGATWMIYFHQLYWEKKYPNWGKMSQEERIQTMDEKRMEIEKTLTGPDSTGKTITSNMVMPHSNDPSKSVKLLEIVALNDPRKDGAQLEDDRQAAWHLMTAVGINGAVLGSIPGTDGALGGNSGSNTNSSTNQQLAFITYHATIVLGLLNFAARYNGWRHKGRQIVWQMKNLKFKLDNQLAPEQRGI
ncbi:MAG: hypothetical protein AAF740_03300 [Bacteroidota bacterium]